LDDNDNDVDDAHRADPTVVHAGNETAHSAPRSTEDDRFDQFLIDPTFKISQTHPDYKEAVDFLRYMRRRKVQHPNLSVGRA
uniref:AGC-kinase C-terminal domain-containing protein n=1 Tax=Echinostoma caproni TaxID=27848 RepID=A0A183B7M8_9TREM